MGTHDHEPSVPYLRGQNDNHPDTTVEKYLNEGPLFHTMIRLQSDTQHQSKGWTHFPTQLVLSISI